MKHLVLFSLSILSVLMLASPFAAMPGYAQESRESWKLAVGGAVLSVSSISDISGDGADDVIAGAQDRSVYAVDGVSGDKLWTFVTNSSVYWTMAHPSGAVWAVSGDSVFLLNGQSGEMEWKYDIPNGSGGVACPENIRSIHMISDVTGDGIPEAIVVSNTDSQCIKNDRVSIVALDTQDGSAVWEYSHAQDNHSLMAGNPGSTPVAVADMDNDGVQDIAFVDNLDILYVIDGKDGAEMSATQIELSGVIWNLMVIPDISGDGVTDAVALESVDGGGGPDNARVTAINLVSASKIWSYAVGDSTFHSGAVYSSGYSADATGDGKPEVVVTIRIDNEASAVTLNGGSGDEMQKLFLGTDRSRDDISKYYLVSRVQDNDADGIEVAIASTSVIYVQNIEEGNTEWSHSLKSPIAISSTNNPEGKKDQVFVGSSDGFVRALAQVLGTETSITLSISSGSVGPGERLTVSGSISPPLPGELVEISYVTPQGSVSKKSLIVQKEGVFTDVLTPEEIGDWKVFAKFSKKQNYLSSESQTVEFNVDTTLDRTFALTLDENEYPIAHKFVGGQIITIDVDKEEKSLKVAVESTQDGRLEIELPRELIDAAERYVVTVDGDVVQYGEIKSSSGARTLSIPLDIGSKDVTIIGTYVVPEFPVAFVALATAAVMVVVAVIGRSKLLGCHIGDSM